MSKSITEISSILNSLNAGLDLFRRPESYVDDWLRWSCTIRLASNAAKIEVRAEGASLSEVLGMAYDKLEPLIEAPAVSHALDLPLLSPPVESDPQF